jgi:hypothetical protein
VVRSAADGFVKGGYSQVICTGFAGCCVCFVLLPNVDFYVKFVKDCQFWE